VDDFAPSHPLLRAKASKGRHSLSPSKKGEELWEGDEELTLNRKGGIFVLIGKAQKSREEKMRKWTLGLVAVLMLSFTSYGVAQEEQSIGTVAGTSAREMQDSADESYEVANKKAEEALAEIKETSDDALKTFIEEAEKMLRDLQVTAQRLVEALQREIANFKKSYFTET